MTQKEWIISAMNNFASDEKGASMHIGRARTQEQAICTTLYF
jgi:hypothetical protein